jgi:bacterioferritin (cytochrome b1)
MARLGSPSGRPGRTGENTASERAAHHLARALHAHSFRVMQTTPLECIQPVMLDDRERILNRLQAALRHERLAAACYRNHAKRAAGLEQPAIAERLAIMANVHATHAQRLTVRIEELGGKASPVNGAESVVNDNSCEDGQIDLAEALEHDLRLEDTEIEEYEILSGQSDDRTAELCEGHIREDKENLQWLREQVVADLDEIASDER